MLLGIGVDIIGIENFRRIVDKSGERFINRIFTPAEIHYCDNKVHRFQHLAARFTCKEAISKALKMAWSDGLNWKDIEVLNDKNGQPKVKLRGRAKKTADYLEVEDIQLSLSHCPDYAVAMAVILRGDRNGAD